MRPTLKEFATCPWPDASARQAFAVERNVATTGFSMGVALVLLAVIVLAWPTDLLHEGMAAQFLPMRLGASLALLSFIVLAPRMPALFRAPESSIALLVVGGVAFTATGGAFMHLDLPWSGPFVLLPLVTVVAWVPLWRRVLLNLGVVSLFAAGYFAFYPDQWDTPRAREFTQSMLLAAAAAACVGHLGYYQRWRAFLAARALAAANRRLEATVAEQTQAITALNLREQRLMDIEAELVQSLLSDVAEVFIDDVQEDLAAQPPTQWDGALVDQLLGDLSVEFDRLRAESPPFLVTPGALDQALEAMVDRINAPLRLHLATALAPLPEPPPQEVALAAYRVSQEAVNNALKHARARQIMVALTPVGEGFELLVSDDGIGLEAGTRSSNGLGLASMRARARSAGADLTFDEGAGHGTRVCFTWHPPPNK